MSRWRAYFLGIMGLGGLLLTGCGGSMFRSAKTIADPLALNGRRAQASVSIGGDALTASLSAQGNGEYSFGNSIASLAPYEGLESLTLRQNIRLRLEFNPNSNMPASVTLRNVSLHIRLRISDSDSGGNAREYPILRSNYNGTLTLARQTDGSYVAKDPLPLSSRLRKSEAETLLAILAGGTANVMSIEANLQAETARANIENVISVTLSITFDNGSAYIEW